jgi:hypothetical protein
VCTGLSIKDWASYAPACILHLRFCWHWVYDSYWFYALFFLCFKYIKTLPRYFELRYNLKWRFNIIVNCFKALLLRFTRTHYPWTRNPLDLMRLGLCSIEHSVLISSSSYPAAIGAWVFFLTNSSFCQSYKMLLLPDPLSDFNQTWSVAPLTTPIHGVFTDWGQRSCRGQYGQKCDFSLKMLLLPQKT